MVPKRIDKMAAALVMGCWIGAVQASTNPFDTGGPPPVSLKALSGKGPGDGTGEAFAAGESARSVAMTQQDVTTINGRVPPGIVTPAGITLLLSAPLGGGQVLYQYRTVRQPGTRAPIHTHPHGGSTCILKGESTLRVEGIPGARTYRAGQCFWMPHGPAMANFNSGRIPFTAIDTFILRPGEKPMKVVEPGASHIYEDHL